ncbi:Uncharacterised protein [Mycobacterium tuberculosis]|nr:Uncharacterised protein [Mycobacterium tuberculosis]COU58425.1 Uncharacterised protein [Mycobacterium tuberculosis]
MTVAMATGRCAPMSSASSPSSGNVARDTGSTKTSMMPPQVRPTANAVSSLTPQCSSRGIPVWATSAASSYTAPSTQPPDTDPLTEPSGATTIAAPGGRGADRKVRTTVATPAVSPAAQIAISSASTSRTLPKVGFSA